MEDNEIMNAEEIEVTEDGEVIETEGSDEQKEAGCGKYVFIGGVVAMAGTALLKYVVVPGAKKLCGMVKTKIAEKKAAKAEAKEKKDSEVPEEE